MLPAPTFDVMIILAWVLAAIAGMVLGGIWFGPLFGKIWMRGMGWDPNNKEQMEKMKKSAGPAYGMQAANSIVMGFLIWLTLGFAQVGGWMDGLLFALIASITFQTTSLLSTAIWSGSKPLFVVNTTYYALNHAIAGAIIGAFM